MSDRHKFILRILLFFLATGVLAYGVYFMAFRPDLKQDIQQEKPPSETTNTGTLPTSEEAGDRTQEGTGTGKTGELPIASPIAQGGPTLITRLTQSAILAPTTSGSQAMYYDPNDGYFYRIGQDGAVEQFSNTAFPKAEKVTVDEKANHAVLEFPDGSNVIYNIVENRQITMPPHWTDFSFAPNGTSVVAKAIADENNSSLVVMSSDGSRAYAVQDMGGNADKVQVQWSPDGEYVALSNTGPAQAGFGRRAILLIDQEGEAPGSIIIDGTNFQSKWNPSGSHLLFSTSDPARSDRPGLWYVKASGQEIGAERKFLDVDTWAEKCVFKNETYILCAVPRVIEDYQGHTPLFNQSTDDVYEINVLTGRKKVLAQPTINARMFNMTLSEDQATLYFTDQGGRLNYIRLE